MKSNLGFPDNVSLNFNANGVEIRVSLNIPASLKHFISPNNLFKGDVYWVYSIKTQVNSESVSKRVLEETKNALLTRAMANVRRAKSKQYQSQSDKLSHQLTLFES